jgi:hypothetical protein
VIWAKSFDGDDTVVVDKFGMKESCFCKGLRAFMSRYEKDEFSP